MSCATLAENGGQAMGLLRIRSIRDTPRSFQGLDVEKPQGTQVVRHCAGRQLLFGEQVSLVLSNVLWTQTIRRAVEMPSEPFDMADVVVCGTLGVVTTLEFLQHDFS